MIPKIIHQTYKDYNLNKIFKECQQNVKHYYKDFDYRFYTDKDMEKFVKDFYPEFKEKVFDKLPVHIMKVDVFRYLLLEKYGGVYMDLDHRVIRKYPFEGGKLFLPKSRETKLGNKIDLIGNCILASVPEHPFWKYVRDELEKNLDKMLSDKTQKKDKRHYVIVYTGPKFITEVYNKYQQELKDTSIVLPGRNVFHRKKPKSSIILDRYQKDPDTFGFHYCTGSWLK